MFVLNTYYRNAENSIILFRVQKFNTEAECLRAIPPSTRIVCDERTRTYNVIPM